MRTTQWGIHRVRALLRVVREGVELREAGRSPHRHMVEQVAKMIGAFAGIAGTAIDISKLGFAAPTELFTFGLDDGAVAQMFGHFRRRSIEADPFTMRLCTRDMPTQVTVMRHDVAADGEWYRSEMVNGVHRPLRLDHHVLSLRRLGGSATRVLCFKRAWGERAFTSEDRDLVDLFHAECAWLDQPAPSLPAEARATLSVREQQTLEQLLTAASEKQIAARLGLSHHTTHDYVKAVYRKLGVQSRAELMSRFLPAAAMNP